MTNLTIQTPRWAVPLLYPARYKGAYGGRSGGKSHFFAELMVEECLQDRNLPCVCIREIQKSLKFSAKRVIEAKIRDLGVRNSFRITNFEIERVGGEGIIIFQGMQDHTADSIKSLEGFKRGWVEEGQNLSARSLRLLRPTIIRTPGAQLWFSWNPEQPEDPVDEMFRGAHPPKDMILVEVNYYDNPFLTKESFEEAEEAREKDLEEYMHTWEGAYNTKSDAQIFAGKCIVKEFDMSRLGTISNPPGGPYYGLDFGFSQDPTAAIRCWIWDNKLWVDYTVGKIGVDITDTNELVCEIPGAHKEKIVADCARPETISHMRKSWVDYSGRKRPGLNVVPCEKWNGSVEDGITYLKTFDQIIIHPRCKGLIFESVNYRYKIDRNTEEPTTTVEDKNNHYWDAIRYALGKLIKAFRGADLDDWV